MRRLEAPAIPFHPSSQRPCRLGTPGARAKNNLLAQPRASRATHSRSEKCRGTRRRLPAFPLLDRSRRQPLVWKVAGLHRQSLPYRRPYVRPRAPNPHSPTIPASLQPCPSFCRVHMSSCAHSPFVPVSPCPRGRRLPPSPSAPSRVRFSLVCVVGGLASLSPSTDFVCFRQLVGWVQWTPP